MALKFSCVSQICSLQNWPPKFLEKQNLTAILLVLIPELCESNTT